MKGGMNLIIDVTGTILTPGNQGKDCLGNGEHPEVECCCDECDYLLCCTDIANDAQCKSCADRDCPRAGKNGM